MNDDQQEEYQEDKPPIFAEAEAEAAENAQANPEPPIEEVEVRESSVQKAKTTVEEDGREVLKTNSGVVFGYK